MCVPAVSSGGEEEPDFSLATHTLQFGAHAFWEKVQTKQEQRKPPQVDVSQLLVTPEEIVDCAAGKSHVAVSEVVQQMTELEVLIGSNTDNWFTRTYDNEDVRRWRCSRSIEAIAVAALAISIKKVVDIPQFLKRLKQVAYARARVSS